MPSSLQLPFADNYLLSAHNQCMNKVLICGQFLTTVHCSLSPEGVPPPPIPLGGINSPKNRAD